MARSPAASLTFDHLQEVNCDGVRRLAGESPFLIGGILSPQPDLNRSGKGLLCPGEAFPLPVAFRFTAWLSEALRKLIRPISSVLEVGHLAPSGSVQKILGSGVGCDDLLPPGFRKVAFAGVTWCFRWTLGSGVRAGAGGSVVVCGHCARLVESDRRWFCLPGRATWGSRAGPPYLHLCGRWQGGAL